MIIYKRKITGEDIENLDKEEQLIYYMTDDLAITIIRLKMNIWSGKKGFQIIKRLMKKFLRQLKMFLIL